MPTSSILLNIIACSAMKQVQDLSQQLDSYSLYI